jgi:hypothetical protein
MDFLQIQKVILFFLGKKASVKMITPINWLFLKQKPEVFSV